MDLREASALLAAAEEPEDIFVVGATPEDDVKARYRELAKIVHSDLYPDPDEAAVASEAFKKLGELHEAAQKKLADGTLGDRSAINVTIKGRLVEYTLKRKLEPDLTSSLYTGTKVGETEPLLFRIADDHDLANNERDILTWLRAEAPHDNLPALQHVPVLRDSLEIACDGGTQRVNVFQHFDGYTRLDKVLATWPDGIDLRAAAWMYRRILAALIGLHANGVVHGAVVPSNVYVCMKDKTEKGAHDGKLFDYGFAARGENPGPLKAIIPQWKAYYPNDVFQKYPVDFGVDLHMAAEILCRLVGGVHNLPPLIRGVVRSCQLGRFHRQRVAYEVYDDFDQAIRRIFGKSSFFHLPLPV